MKRILIIAYSSLAILILIYVLYFRSLYNKQITYLSELLDRQTQLVGLSVDNTNNGFVSDLNQIIFSEDLSLFFDSEEVQHSVRERMKLFFSKYGDLVSGIRFYDNRRNEFTLKRDENSWLEQRFVLHVQSEIFSMEKLSYENRKYDYYLPVIKNDTPIGNMVVTIDYQNYFGEIFAAFDLKDYQWEWVISGSGEIFYTNTIHSIEYAGMDRLAGRLSEGYTGNLIHTARINGKSQTIVSSYYSTQLLQRDFGLVFSAPANVFQKYIIRNSIAIIAATILIIQGIIWLFIKRLKKQEGRIEKLDSSEQMLFRMIDEMPVGIIIHNKNREILKANRVAAEQFSWKSEDEMTGKIYPEPSSIDDTDYFSRHLGGSFQPDQFVILKKEIGEIILFRNSIPVNFRGEEADLEILIDVTLLESARKQEAMANVAKSEFLARMSYEIRTPLNGIVGMTDLLGRFDLSEEVREITALLQSSAGVLLSIIDDILDFSKIESGKMILDEMPVKLRDELRYCIELAENGTGDKNLAIKCHVDENVPDNIIGDPYRIRQVITSLLNNSIYNTHEGEIRLSCTKEDEGNGTLVLRFELLDTGQSYDKASLKKIFGDYVNIESKTHKEHDESGFGTVLARQLIELMGGRLKAESPSGIAGDKGIRVIFTIKAWRNEKNIKDVPAGSITSFGMINTLIITGELNRDEEILAICHRLGLSLTVTTFQKSTVGQIRANLNYPDKRYHVIAIIDEKEFNGFEAAEALYENNLSGKFIIFVISSNDRRGNYLKSITTGVDHYMVKPVEINDLGSRIRAGFPNIGNAGTGPEENEFRRDIRILIVEDNKMNQKVISTLLLKLGITADVADDGYKGYLQAKTRHYDIIFMDLIMPEMDGYESARRILEYDSNTLIAAFTADSLPESRKKAELSGIREFIPKPVRIDDLRNLLNRYFPLQ